MPGGVLVHVQPCLQLIEPDIGGLDSLVEDVETGEAQSVLPAAKSIFSPEKAFARAICRRLLSVCVETSDGCSSSSKFNQT